MPVATATVREAPGARLIAVHCAARSKGRVEDARRKYCARSSVISEFRQRRCLVLALAIVHSMLHMDGGERLRIGALERRFWRMLGGRSLLYLLRHLEDD